MESNIKIPNDVWELIQNMPWSFHHRYFFLLSKGMKKYDAFDFIVSDIRAYFPDWDEFSSLESYEVQLSKIKHKKEIEIPLEIFLIIKDMPKSFDTAFYKCLSEGMSGKEAFGYLMLKVRRFLPRWRRSENYNSYMRAKNYRITQLLKGNKKS